MTAYYMDLTQLQAPRRLACRRCYRHKLRCAREPDAPKCARCTKMGVICEDRPEKSMGRPRASRSLTRDLSRGRQTYGSVERNADIQPHFFPSAFDRIVEQRQFHIGVPQEVTISDDMFAEVSQQPYTSLHTFDMADNAVLQQQSAPTDNNLFNFSTEYTDLSHTDSSTVESLAQENLSHLELRGRLPMASSAGPGLPRSLSQKTSWTQHPSLPEFENDQTSHFKRRKTVSELSQRPYIAPTALSWTTNEDCVESLLDLQKLLARLQHEKTQQDPLAGFDLNGYPFTNLCSSQELLLLTNTNFVDQRGLSGQHSYPPTLKNLIKRVFAASHLFLELVQALNTISGRNRSQQNTGVSTSHSGTPCSSRQGSPQNPYISYGSPQTESSQPTMHLSTPLNIINCYIRLLDLYTSIIDRMTTVYPSQLIGSMQRSRSASMLTPGTNSQPSPHPLQGRSTPPTFTNQVAGPIIHLISYLVGATDDSLCDYLLNNVNIHSGGTAPTSSTTLSDQSLKSSRPHLNDLASVIEATCPPIASEMVAFHDKLRQSLRICESSPH